ncbi:MAG: hypothetical protein AB7H90_03355 [Alphaproteobacteria bacterium]
MILVTNGTIEYGRTVKPADYENKSAKVTLSFAVEEGSDPATVISTVYDIAVAEVHRRLGLAAPVNTAKVETPKRIAGQDKKEAAAAPQPDPISVPAPTAAETAAPSSAPPATATHVEASDPLAITAPEPAPVTPAVITDVDLRVAAAQAVERKVPVTAIHGLTHKYTGVVGKSMTEIPQEQRPDFLKELKELRAA